jgi:hypothetical protein
MVGANMQLVEGDLKAMYTMALNVIKTNNETILNYHIDRSLSWKEITKGIQRIAERREMFYKERVRKKQELLDIII